MSVEALYFQYSPFVRRTLRSRGLRDASLDDAVQDVFLVVHRRLEVFVPHASPKTWIYAISARVARNYQRRAKRKEGLFSVDTLELIAPEPAPDVTLWSARRLRLANARLSRLDEKQRTVFVLSELEQMTAPEIAQSLRLKLNTVYSRLRAARRTLRLPPSTVG